MGIGHIGNNRLMKNVLFNVQKQLSQQADLFEQISSNKRILDPSSDPLGTSQSMSLRDQSVRNTEYDDVINTSELWTNISATSLDNALETWKRVNEITITAVDGTKTAADRIAMAEELEQLLQHMVQVGNTTNGQRFIFGGSVTQTPPFSTETDAATGRITGVYYQGNSFNQQVKSSDSGRTQVNVVGSNAGDPTVKGAFVDTTTNTDAFKIMVEIRDKLLSNDIIGISGPSGYLEKIETAGLNLTEAQVNLGGAQERQDLDRNRIIEQTSDIQEFLSEIEDADVAELILELNNVQNVYEAALAAGGRIMQTGLLNYI
ncbi:hypothetical protein SCG7109_AB_00530 [Chlamydiales bacterium SCGC AG-110-M15]|nr:hypothetical protein SCG7109_AB_00530 [Chlamydiales bacterium SCGC AG-110-M15]